MYFSSNVSPIHVLCQHIQTEHFWHSIEEYIHSGMRKCVSFGDQKYLNMSCVVRLRFSRIVINYVHAPLIGDGEDFEFVLQKVFCCLKRMWWWIMCFCNIILNEIRDLSCPRFHWDHMRIYYIVCDNWGVVGVLKIKHQLFCFCRSICAHDWWETAWVWLLTRSHIFCV